MSGKTKAQLLGENATLQMRLIALEEQLAAVCAGETTLPEQEMTTQARAEDVLRPHPEALAGGMGEHTGTLGHAYAQLQPALGNRPPGQVTLQREASVIALSMQAMALTDLETKITYVNDAFVRMYQYGMAEEMLGTAVLDYIASPQALHSALTVLPGTGGWVGDLVGTRRGGSTFPMRLAVSLIPAGNGTPTFMLVLCLDLTEDTRTVKALQEKWEHLARAQHLTHLGSWEWNLRTETMCVSAEMCRLLGLARDGGPPTYAALLTHVHPEDQTRYDAAVQESLALHCSYRIEHRIVEADGASMVVLSEGQGDYDATDTPVCLVGTMQDLSVFTQAEAAGWTSEGRYRRLFETAQDGIIILDAETGKISEANPYLIEMLEYTHDELIGKALWEIGSFRDIAANQAAFRQLQTNSYIRYENLPLETKSGVHKQVEFVSNVYLVDGQRVIQCNIRDITARKHIEDEIRQTHDELLLLVASLQKRDEEMQSLNHLHDLLQACTTATEAYEVVTQIVGKLFDGQSGCVAVFHPTERQLEVTAQWGKDGGLDSLFSLEDCWAMRRGHLHEAFGPYAGMQCRHFTHPPQDGHVCVPLMVHGAILGVLCLLKQAEHPREHQLRQQALAVAVGEAIKMTLSSLQLRGELRDQAIHDELTGLYNRRYLEDSLKREVYRAQRRTSPLCVVMLDLDHFKHFNDTFGHAAGDMVLRAFGKLLLEHLRKSDISCRYGGEEFVLVLPDAASEDARQRVVQIGALLKELEIQHGAHRLRQMTVSAGIAQVNAHLATASEVLHAADLALYAAKQAGRDCVVVFQVRGEEETSSTVVAPQ